LYILQNLAYISDETIIESQSKIEYFGHNRTQSKSWY